MVILLLRIRHENWNPPAILQTFQPQFLIRSSLKVELGLAEREMRLSYATVVSSGQNTTTGWGPPVISWFIYHYNPH